MSRLRPVEEELEQVSLLDRLLQCDRLPSPPTIAQQILALANSNTATMRDVAEVISVDTALAARLLRFANSPLYGQRRQIDTIRQAVTLLGMDATLNHALGFTLVSGMKKQSQTSLDHGQFWRRSLGAAAACRLLAQHRQVSAAETFFMGALIQDAGMLALESVQPDAYEALGENQADHNRVHAHELGVFGIDHSCAGAWLINSWNLPTKYCQAVQASHNPRRIEIDPEHAELVNCVATSGLIADIIYGHDLEVCVERCLSTGAELVELTTAVLGNMLGNLVGELGELGSLFELDLGETEWLQQRVEKARSVLEPSAQAVTA